MNTRRGFTLIELLVVIAIIGILLGLLVAAAQRVREAAARTQCINHLKQVGLALHQYHDVQHRFPPGYVSAFDAAGNDTGPGWGWAAHVLPYLEQENVFRQIDLQQPIEAAASAQGRTQVIQVFMCPSDNVAQHAFPVGARSNTGQLLTTICTVAPANYVGNFGVTEPGVDGEGVFFRNSAVTLTDISDGTSQTFLVGERSFRYSEGTWVGAVTGAQHAPTPGSPLPFLEPEAANFVLAHTGETYQGPAYPEETNHFSAPHARGGNFVFADGHVAYLSRATTYQTFKALSTRSGSETIHAGEY